MIQSAVESLYKIFCYAATCDLVRNQFLVALFDSLAVGVRQYVNT
jgi:hypothetical protein